MDVIIRLMVRFHYQILLALACHHPSCMECCTAISAHPITKLNTDDVDVPVAALAKTLNLHENFITL